MSWLFTGLALSVISFGVLGVVYYVTPCKEYHQTLEIAMLVVALVMAVFLLVLFVHVWEPSPYRPHPGHSF